VDEAQLALVEVGEREFVVARAGGEEAAEQLCAAGGPAVPGVWVAAALVLGPAGAERGEVAGRDLLALGIREALVLLGVGLAQPPEVVVEGPVLHHQDDEVVDLDVARLRERVVPPVGLRGLGQDRRGGQGGAAGEAGCEGRAL
jgi:hypothetical protein